MRLSLRLPKSNRFSTLFILAALFVSGLLTGCADGVFNAEDSSFQARTNGDSAHNGSKLRHAHLLDRAYKAKRNNGHAAGKGASSHDLYLIVAVPSGVNKLAVLDRYSTLDRYATLERYDYNLVFDGFAWTIGDSLGLGDYGAFLDSLAADPDILWFEPDFDVTTPPSSAVPGSAGQMIPWSVAAIGGQTSWTISGDGTGSVDVDLYILDTGITNSDINVVESLDFRDGFNDASDYDGHGTHIAGIAAAVDDTLGLVGVAPGARVHNFKVLGDDGTSDVSVIIAAVEHILAEKLANPSVPMVVNMSLGEDVGTTAYTALDEVIAAASAQGVVFVVAAGNQGSAASNVTPAHVQEAITVGSYDVLNQFSPFSNWGPKVDILAPGEGVVSLAPSSSGPGTPVEMTGTSMAAPHVAGAAALYLAQNPSATPAQVQQALLAAAKSDVTGAPGNTTNQSVWVGEQTVEVRVASGNDDAEEEVSSGDMYRTSSDLELVDEDSTPQLVGMRFTGLTIPQGATITAAYIQFTVDETDSGTTSLTIRGQDADDAASFSWWSYDISSRATTSASASWSPAAWNSVGEAGSDQRTPDLSAIIQEIVDRGGWSSGNDLAIIVSGTGERTAESYNGSSSNAPLLHVEYQP